MSDLPDDEGLPPTALRCESGPYVGTRSAPLTRFARHPGLDAVMLELSAGFGPQHWWPALELLRNELLGVFGVGPETADRILCFTAGRRTPVVDAYTLRILRRHDLFPADRPYEEVRGWLREVLVDSQLVYGEFHALCVLAGSRYCKPKPDCESCPATAPERFSR